jgi:hypothetical protein
MFSTRTSKTAYAAGDVLKQMRGPMTGRNWFDTAVDPIYNIRQTGTAVIRLEGTNDRALRSDYPNPFTKDMEPSEGASWTSIASGAGALSGSITVDYEFLRLVCVTAGTGDILEAWVRWE